MPPKKHPHDPDHGGFSSEVPALPRPLARPPAALIGPLTPAVLQHTPPLPVKHDGKPPPPPPKARKSVFPAYEHPPQ